eukprot:30883-Pelagococcus_subviridis.AAC.4
MHVVLPREQRLASEQLREDAPHAPHVDRGGVFRAREQELGRAVPSRDDVLGEEVLRALRRSRQAKVADFQVAVCVQQQVRRLQVAM